MLSQSRRKLRPEHIQGAAAATERRRYKRVSLPLMGRFMRESKKEFSCRLVDISIGGARLLTNIPVPPGERIIISFDDLGSLEGTAIRSFEDGFAIDFTNSHRRRQKLAAQLTWLVNRDDPAMVEDRRKGHERATTIDAISRVVLADGRTIPCTVLNFSISGVLFESSERPEIGSPISIGKRHARVIRHHETGFAVEFIARATTEPVVPTGT